MKYIIPLLFILTGCSNISPEIRSRAKTLCCSQGGLWYIQSNWFLGARAKCNNGALFFQIEDIEINPTSVCAAVR